MVNQRLFDRRYGKGAFDRLRSMLDDPASAYQDIAEKFDSTRQRIAQIADELGINGTQRQRERWSRLEPHIVKRFKEYPSDIRAVMNKLNSPQPSTSNLFLTLQKMVVVNGVVCAIQLRKANTKSRYGREYARFDVNAMTRKGKVAL